MKRCLVLLPIVALLSWCSSLSAQTTQGLTRFATVVDGDTIPMYQLHDVSIISSHQFLTDKEKRQNKKLIRNVKKMLPYALEGKRRLDALEAQIASMPKRKRNEAIKAAENKLRKDFEEDLKQCTFSQGKVLIKLIDRETGRTSYNLVGELRGTFRASFYQVFARIFGFNLKTHYDPQNNKDDELMERVIKAVQHHQV
ncbi:MAG: DUF4294 domain-containing protein [Bacteroidales bacterium]|nr:DUF4294 domain-containing protein [Bacteroidales bacterium]